MEPVDIKRFRFAEYELDSVKRVLLKDGNPLPLTSKSFDLLAALVERHGEVLNKDELLETVWPDQIVEEGNLTVHVSNLRKVFGEGKGEHKFIVTIPGRGYSFVADVVENPNGEILVERHSLSRIVIEESDQDANHEKQVAANTRDSRKSTKNLRLSAGIFAVVAIAALGFWIYQRSQSRPTFAAAWVDPSQAPKPTQLTTNGKVAFAALSPDGQHFAYTVGQTDKPSLWYAHTNGKQQVEIRPPEVGMSYQGLTFGPDGNEIYYVANDEKNRLGALFRIPVLGSVPPQRVLTNIDSPVTFSPDGKRVAFIRNGTKQKLSVVVIADATNGENEVELASRPLDRHFTIRGPAWSPDGKQIAVGAVIGTPLAEETVMLVNAENGTTEQLGSKTFNQVRRVAWLHDGSGLYVNAVEKDVWDDRHLWLIEYPAGRAHKVTQDLFHYGMFNLSVSDDGSKVLSVSSSKICNIFVSPADDLSQGKKITANSLGKQAGAVGMTWAGSKIVYGAFFDKGQTLWVMDADGSNARQLTPPGFLDRFPSAIADTVVFASSRGTDGGSTIWRTGIESGQLKELGIGNRPSISPDGRWILYGSRSEEGFTSVYKIPADGGERIRLTTKPSGYVRVSPDGKLFACSYNPAVGEKTQLAVFSIDGGEPLEVFDVTPGANLSIGIRWTPDGKSLVYRDFGPSLWKQNINDKGPEKLLEFPDEIIYSFDWSPDGKQFAVAHGEDVRDVVLLTKNPN